MGSSALRHGGAVRAGYSVRLILTALACVLVAACGQLPGGSRTATPRVEVLIDNLKIPMSLAFTPDGRLFFTGTAAVVVSIAAGCEALSEIRLKWPDRKVDSAKA